MLPRTPKSRPRFGKPPQFFTNRAGRRGTVFPESLRARSLCAKTRPVTEGGLEKLGRRRFLWVTATPIRGLRGIELKTVPNVSGAETAAVTLADERAGQKEAAAIAEGKYDERENARSDRLRHHVHLSMLCGIWLFSAVFSFFMLAVAWHYLMSDKWEWLTAEQLSTIKTFLFSGTVTGSIGGYFGSRIRGLSVR
jgi:hypothetical protein